MTTAQVPVDTAWMDDFASLLERPGPELAPLEPLPRIIDLAHDRVRG